MKDAESTAALFRQLIEEAKLANCKLVRNAGSMDWGLSKMSSTRELTKLEAVYDLYIGRESPTVALCQYDLRAFGSEVILDALRTHPLCIIGGLIHTNPFYISLGQFLKEQSEFSQR